MVTELWTGARRLPYFFTLRTDTFGVERGAVLCPQCATQYVTEASVVRPRYFASRSLMCVKCSVLIGPINEEETLYE